MVEPPTPQLGLWKSQYDGKNNPNVPKHQPDIDLENPIGVRITIFCIPTAQVPNHFGISSQKPLCLPTQWPALLPVELSGEIGAITVVFWVNWRLTKTLKENTYKNPKMINTPLKYFHGKTWEPTIGFLSWCATFGCPLLRQIHSACSSQCDYLCQKILTPII